MRILHLLSQTELTGSEVHAHELIKMQIQDGHTVFAISDHFHLDFPCQTMQLPLNAKGFFARQKNIFSLRKFLQENHIEIIHSHSRAACRHAYWARLGTTAIQVSTLHGRQHFSWSKRFFNIYGTYIITICENLRQSLLKDFLLDPNDLRIIRNPFQLKNYPFRNEERPPKKLALISRSSGPKGSRLQAVVLHCVESWLRRFPDMQIDIITTSIEKLNPVTIEMVKNLNGFFGEKIHIQGMEAGLHEKYKDYDMVVGAGRVAIEALLSGCAVFALGEAKYQGLVNLENFDHMMASNFGDINDDRAIDPFDPGNLFTDVVELVNTYSTWSKQRQALAQKAAEEYDIQSIHSDVLETYKAARARFFLPVGSRS